MASNSLVAPSEVTANRFPVPRVFKNAYISPAELSESSRNATEKYGLGSNSTRLAELLEQCPVVKLRNSITIFAAKNAGMIYLDPLPKKMTLFTTNTGDRFVVRRGTLGTAVKDLYIHNMCVLFYDGEDFVAEVDEMGYTKLRDLTQAEKEAAEMTKDLDRAPLNDGFYSCQVEPEKFRYAYSARKESERTGPYRNAIGDRDNLKRGPACLSLIYDGRAATRACENTFMAGGGTQCMLGRLFEALPKQGFTTEPYTLQEAETALAASGWPYATHWATRTKGSEKLEMSERWLSLTPLKRNLGDTGDAVRLNLKASMGPPYLTKATNEPAMERAFQLAQFMLKDPNWRENAPAEYQRMTRLKPWLGVNTMKVKTDTYSRSKVLEDKMRVIQEGNEHMKMLMSTISQTAAGAKVTIPEVCIWEPEKLHLIHSAQKMDLGRNGARMLLDSMNAQLEKDGISMTTAGDDSIMIIKATRVVNGVKRAAAVGMEMDCASFDLNQTYAQNSALVGMMVRKLSMIDQQLAALWGTMRVENIALLHGAGAVKLEGIGNSGTALQSELNDAEMLILLGRLKKMVMKKKRITIDGVLVYDISVEEIRDHAERIISAAGHKLKLIMRNVIIEDDLGAQVPEETLQTLRGGLSYEEEMLSTMSRTPSYHMSTRAQFRTEHETDEDDLAQALKVKQAAYRKDFMGALMANAGLTFKFVGFMFTAIYNTTRPPIFEFCPPIMWDNTLAIKFWEWKTLPGVPPHRVSYSLANVKAQVHAVLVSQNVSCIQTVTDSENTDEFDIEVLRNIKWLLEKEIINCQCDHGPGLAGNLSRLERACEGQEGAPDPHLQRLEEQVDDELSALLNRIHAAKNFFYPTPQLNPSVMLLPDFERFVSGLSYPSRPNVQKSGEYRMMMVVTTIFRALSAGYPWPNRNVGLANEEVLDKIGSFCLEECLDLIDSNAPVTPPESGAYLQETGMESLKSVLDVVRFLVDHRYQRLGNEAMIIHQPERNAPRNDKVCMRRYFPPMRDHEPFDKIGNVMKRRSGRHDDDGYYHPHAPTNQELLNEPVEYWISIRDKMKKLREQYAEPPITGPQDWRSDAEKFNKDYTFTFRTNLFGRAMRNFDLRFENKQRQDVRYGGPKRFMGRLAEWTHIDTTEASVILDDTDDRTEAEQEIAMQEEMLEDVTRAAERGAQVFSGSTDDVRSRIRKTTRENWGRPPPITAVRVPLKSQLQMDAERSQAQSKGNKKTMKTKRYKERRRQRKALTAEDFENDEEIDADELD